jgi:hypothetical protein
LIVKASPEKSAINARNRTRRFGFDNLRLRVTGISG